EISKDLRHAKIKVSIMSNDEKEIKSTIKALIRAKSYIRKVLSKSLKTMYTPEIFFEFIDLGESMRIFDILNKIKEEEKKI
ncbi:MAG: ribosome-binding factor A, partial [Brevinematia bacterium]